MGFHLISASVISILFVAAGILPPPAVAQQYGITYEPDTVYVGDEVQFTANLPPDIPKTEEEWGYWYILYLVWGWNFGDGEVVRTYAEQIPHTYTEAGIYTVALEWYYWKVYYYEDTGKYAVRYGFATYLTTVEVLSEIPATIDIDPDTLNLVSNGKWVTVYIEFPEGYDMHEIDISTVMLNEEVPAENDPKYDFVSDPEGRIGDYDDDGILDCMVKFDKSDVQGILEVGDEVEITVTGELYDETPFEGSGTIRVTSKGKGK